VIKIIEYEKYYGKIIKIGDSLGVTIPYNICKYAGYNVNDEVIIMIKKQV